jgi:hypothetical protein
MYWSCSVGLTCQSVSDLKEMYLFTLQPGSWAHTMRQRSKGREF